MFLDIWADGDFLLLLKPTLCPPCGVRIFALDILHCNVYMLTSSDVDRIGFGHRDTCVIGDVLHGLNLGRMTWSLDGAESHIKRPK
jgi:hypothetical protein